MGSSQSSSTTAEHPVSTIGVGTLVREIGLAMIPVHLRHSLESVMQILGNRELLEIYSTNSNLTSLD